MRKIQPENLKIMVSNLTEAAGHGVVAADRDPRIKGPQPRLITIEQAEAMERHRKEMEEFEKDEASREVAR